MPGFGAAVLGAVGAAAAGNIAAYGAAEGAPVLFTLVGGTVTVSSAPVPAPEPGTRLLMGAGLVGLAGSAWRRRKQA